MVSFVIQRRRVACLFLAVLFACSVSAHAQHVTRINPSHITFRGVCLSSLWTGMVVGDSNYVAVTHHDYDEDDAPSFFAVQSPFASSTMLDAVAYAGDTLHAVIAGEKGTLAWTSDGGTAWHDVSLGVAATIRAIKWNKSTSSPLLVGVGDGGLVIRSSDQGQTWKTITSRTSVQLNGIDFGTPNDAVAVGRDTTMIQTHDGGQTWSPMPFPYNFHTWYGGQFENKMGVINFSAVAMNGPDTVYVAFDTAMVPLTVYKGTAIDTSQEWYHKITVTNADLPATVTVTGLIDTLWPHYTSLLYIGMPNVILSNIGDTTNTSALTEFGTTASDVDYRMRNVDSNMAEAPYSLIGDADGGTDPVTMRLRASAFWLQDTNLIVVMVGDECSVYKHTATPYTGWNLSRHVLPFPGKLNREDFLAVNTLPNGSGFSVSVGPTVQKTTDSGRTWTDLPLPITDQVDSSLNTVYPLDSSSALILGWAGVILKYDHTGFRFLPSGTVLCLHGIAFPSKDTGIIVGDYGTILRSSDRGATWSTVDVSSPAYLLSVAFANERIGVAVGDNGTILRTTDEGTTWHDVNNVLSGQFVSIRQVQAFSNGTFFARAETQLLRSTDFGVHWQIVTIPMSDTCGMNFYSPQIGMIAERSTSSELVPDTAHLAYTINGGISWTQFTVPFWNYNRIVINWVSDHEAILYGCFGFIDDVVISSSGVAVNRVEGGPRAALAVYPNPSSGEVRVEYTTQRSGPVQIELWDEAGKKIQTLMQAEEGTGDHSHALTLLNDLHGSFFIRVFHDGEYTGQALTLK